MDIIPAVRFNLVGERYRLTLGSLWKQPFIYFVKPEPGSFIGQVQEKTAASPLAYMIQMPDGEVLLDVQSELVPEHLPGDWVILHRVLGVWKISAEAELEDMALVDRIKAQVRASNTGRVILDFDSANSADNTVSHAKKEPDPGISFELYSPPQTGIAPALYEYDLFFYNSATAPYDPVMRQFGAFEVVDSITRRT